MVCFDVGGVLIRHHRTWGDGCRAAGLPLFPIADDPEVAAARKELSALHTIGRIDGEEFCRRMAETMRGAYSSEEVARVHHAWLIDEYPGVRAVIEGLHAVPGLSTALLSNTNEMHWARFVPPDGVTPEFGVCAGIHHPHASHLLGLAKPSAEIYAEFARRVGMDADPGAILFFDDLPDNVAAARRQGWTAEIIDHRTDTAAQLMDHLEFHGVIGVSPAGRSPRPARR